MDKDKNLTDLLVNDLIAAAWWISVGVTVAVVSHQINLSLDERRLRKYTQAELMQKAW